MDNSYVIGIDQSTQGTKALLFDSLGSLVCRADMPHEQIISPEGWVSHNGQEIYQNLITLIPALIQKAGIPKSSIVCAGISNQRETSIIWDKSTGRPLAPAVVWQCSRGKEITESIQTPELLKLSREHTGIPLSPYFPAAKLAWLLKHTREALPLLESGRLGMGTMDAYLINRLTRGSHYQTDYSNASRTQLFNIHTLSWDPELCQAFGIPLTALPKPADSNAFFGETDFEGCLPAPIPILGVLGDSHGALFGQGCHSYGMVKTTYGTGSSIMMHTGASPVTSRNGLVTSLAWSLDGKAEYVLEGNLNYTGAVITWLKDSLELIKTPSETEALAKAANPSDTTYLVPAFTGLGAPYWKNDAAAAFIGMTRTTKKAELVKAGLESIAYQITDVVAAMAADAGLTVKELRVDGGPTKNTYLMQFQSSLLNLPVILPDTEELSGMGAAYIAGIKAGIYQKKTLFQKEPIKIYRPQMNQSERKLRLEGWKKAVLTCIGSQ